MTKKRMTTGTGQITVSSDNGRGTAPSGSLVSATVTKVEKLKEEWSKAGIGNAFVFGKIMTSRPDLLLELLQYSMPEMNINSIHDVGKELDISLSIDSHGVRLDVSVQDNAGRTIDVEMQLKDEKNIPRRMRYYSGAIDQTILEKGAGYVALSETVVLFITRFDPFGKGLVKYSFRNLCLEDKKLELGDGSTKIVLNAVGTEGAVSEELKGFLSLVSGKMPPNNGSFADRIQEQVLVARSNSEWRRQYMDWKMTLLNERGKGREEGTLLNQIEIVSKKVKKGLDLSAIADALEMEEDNVRPIWDAVKAAAPEYDKEQILTLLQAKSANP